MFFLIPLLLLALPYNGKPTPENHMEIYAHRSGRGIIAEHTLEGVCHCLELGVHYIDFDVVMTQDGVLVVTHDVTLNPDLTRDETGAFITEEIPIHSLTFAELQRFNVGKLNPDSDYADYFPEQKEVQKGTIPSLREVIAYIKPHDDVGFQIEIKTDPELTPTPEIFAAALNNLLIELNVVDRTEVQSLDIACLTHIKALNPAIKTSFVTEADATTISAHGCDCWSLYEMHATEEKIKAAQRAGLKVIAWGYPEWEGTEYNEAQMHQLIEWKVDGIITDRPDKLRELLAQKGYSLPKPKIIP